MALTAEIFEQATVDDSPSIPTIASDATVMALSCIRIVPPLWPLVAMSVFLTIKLRPNFARPTSHIAGFRCGKLPRPRASQYSEAQKDKSRRVKSKDIVATAPLGETLPHDLIKR